jgi:hypothetical protein
VGDAKVTSTCSVQPDGFVDAVMLVPTPYRVGFVVVTADPNVTGHAEPLVWFDETADCRIAAVPTFDIPETRAHDTIAPVAASPVQSKVSVIDDGEDGTSWSDTNRYSVSRLVDLTAVVTLVNVIPFADAVTVPAATVDGAITNTQRRSSAAGVNDGDAYDVVFAVLPTAVKALVTVATGRFSPQVRQERRWRTSR